MNGELWITSRPSNEGIRSSLDRPQTAADAILYPQGKGVHAIETDVVAGAYFRNSSGELRKVVKIEKDDKGRTRVRYRSKSARLKNGKLDLGPSNPPLMETFLAACGDRLNANQIAQLRRGKVLLAGE